VDGKFEKSLKGCPQDSPLSPMLSNIVLNELDQDEQMAISDEERSAFRFERGMAQEARIDLSE
jgi:hypothetical protein